MIDFNRTEISYDDFRTHFFYFMSLIIKHISTNKRESFDTLIIHLKNNCMNINNNNNSDKINLSEFGEMINELPLSTMYSIWERINKNSDGIIGDSNNLLTLLHICFSLIIKVSFYIYIYIFSFFFFQMKLYIHTNKRKYENAILPQEHDKDYMTFLQRINENLIYNFVSRKKRQELSKIRSDFILSDLNSTSNSTIILGFEDFVDHLPNWLIQIGALLAKYNC